MASPEQLLRDNKLRLTAARKAVLGVFLKEESAQSHADLEVNLDSSVDRVTIYRTLDTFVSSGLLHKIPDDSGAAKYALCSDCNEHEHHDNHVHFKCRMCGISECLNHVHIPAVVVPDGYRTEGGNLLLEGVCARCNN